MTPYGGLTLAGYQGPSKTLPYSTSSTGHREKIRQKHLGVEEKTGESVMENTDSTWGN